MWYPYQIVAQWFRPARSNESLEEHRAIFAAMEAKDALAAKKAMEEHIKNAHSAKG